MKEKKTAMVQARICPDLKNKGDAVLQAIGLSASQAITAMYAQIILHNGLPFALRIPEPKGIQAVDGERL